MLWRSLAADFQQLGLLLLYSRMLQGGARHDANATGAHCSN